MTRVTTNNPLLVSFFSGPGAGKSTFCAATFAQLKWKGVNCEMALEWVKDKVWDNHLDIFKNQLYIFGKQYHRVFRLKGKVDLILTDSPFLLSCIYDESKDPHFKNVVVNAFKAFDTYNVYIKRMKPYVQSGRIHNYDQALNIDAETINLLKDNNIEYDTVIGLPENVDEIVENILKKL